MFLVLKSDKETMFVNTEKIETIYRVGFYTYINLGREFIQIECHADLFNERFKTLLNTNNTCGTIEVLDFTIKEEY